MQSLALTARPLRGAIRWLSRARVEDPDLRPVLEVVADALTANLAASDIGKLDRTLNDMASDEAELRFPLSRRFARPCALQLRRRRLNAACGFSLSSSVVNCTRTDFMTSNAWAKRRYLVSVLTPERWTNSLNQVCPISIFFIRAVDFPETRAADEQSSIPLDYHERHHRSGLSPFQCRRDILGDGLRSRNDSYLHVPQLTVCCGVQQRQRMFLPKGMEFNYFTDQSGLLKLRDRVVHDVSAFVSRLSSGPRNHPSSCRAAGMTGRQGGGSRARNDNGCSRSFAAGPDRAHDGIDAPRFFTALISQLHPRCVAK